MDRPIPAFYCVYLLRSTVSKLAHVYVGSTPNPKRRLRQHNGEIQGGATKTSWDRNRPWEMAVMVTGFPSKIAALQFEWSWQNTYKTRHVDGQDREELHPKDKLPSSGKAPAATLRRRLKDLHTLLRANSFARWPLDVRFFSPEAYAHWQTKVVPSTSYQLPQYTSVAFVGGDSTGLGPEMDTSTTNVTGINAIDVSYRSMLPHVAKCQAHLRATNKIQCAVCNVHMHPDKDLVAFCTRSTCTTASHLSCLPSLFSHGTVAQSPLLPVNGTCPTCNSPLSWTTVAKETSLRARGRAEIDKLLKPARIKKAGASTHGPTATALGREDSDAESEDSLVIRDDIMAGPVTEEKTALPLNNGSLAHDSPLRSHDPLSAVIPDSDWDDIEEVLT